MRHRQREDDGADDLMRAQREHTAARHEDDDEGCQDHGHTDRLQGHVNLEPRSREHFEVTREERADEEQGAPRQNHENAVHTTQVDRVVIVIDTAAEEINTVAALGFMLNKKVSVRTRLGQE